MSDDTATAILARLEELKASLPRDPNFLHDANSAAHRLNMSVATFYREVKRCPTLLARAGIEGTPLYTQWREAQLADYITARGDEEAAAAAAAAFRIRGSRRTRDPLCAPGARPNRVPMPVCEVTGMGGSSEIPAARTGGAPFTTS